MSSELLLPVSEALQSQSPGLDLQREEAEKQAQPRRGQRAHDGAVETHCPGEADLRRPKYYKLYNKNKNDQEEKNCLKIILKLFLTSKMSRISECH